MIVKLYFGGNEPSEIIVAKDIEVQKENGVPYLFIVGMTGQKFVVDSRCALITDRT